MLNIWYLIAMSGVPEFCLMEKKMGRNFLSILWTMNAVLAGILRNTGGNAFAFSPVVLLISTGRRFGHTHLIVRHGVHHAEHQNRMRILGKNSIIRYSFWPDCVTKRIVRRRDMVPRWRCLTAQVVRHEAMKLRTGNDDGQVLARDEPEMAQYSVGIREQPDVT